MHTNIPVKFYESLGQILFELCATQVENCKFLLIQVQLELSLNVINTPHKTEMRKLQLTEYLVKELK
jgi:hypothetical protein